jgi:hypothetical protein
MSATTSGALKTLIEGAGLGLAAYRDDAPERAPLPYVTILEHIAVVPSGSDNRYDTGAGPHSFDETVQVSLWEEWRTRAGAKGESYTLRDALIRLLDGARLPTAPTHVWGVRFMSARRLVEEDTNLVQTALTLEIVRDV